jgi:excisionase family DNA binding protein
MRDRGGSLVNQTLALELTIPGEVVEAVARRVADLLRDASPDQQPTSPWLDVAGACAYLGFTRNTLYRLSAARAIPVRKKADGQGLRFHRDELDAWMEEHYPRLDRLP